MSNKRRIELKATLSSTNYYKLEQWICGQTNLSLLFPDRIVNNIYFETEGYSSGHDNIDGISKRTKVRYRWYGSKDINSDLNGYLEFKRKSNNIGWKDKYSIKLEQKFLKNYNILANKISENLPNNRKIEFSYFKLPFILNSYNRKYFSTNDEKIRVTVDTEITAYDQRWSLNVNKKEKIVLPNIVVVEFKFSEDFKENAIELLNEFPFRISKHSKFITSLLHV